MWRGIQYSIMMVGRGLSGRSSPREAAVMMICYDETIYLSQFAMRFTFVIFLNIFLLIKYIVTQIFIYFLSGYIESPYVTHALAPHPMSM